MTGARFSQAARAGACVYQTNAPADSEARSRNRQAGRGRGAVRAALSNQFRGVGANVPMSIPISLYAGWTVRIGFYHYASPGSGWDTQSRGWSINEVRILPDFSALLGSHLNWLDRCGKRTAANLHAGIGRGGWAGPNRQTLAQAKLPPRFRIVNLNHFRISAAHGTGFDC